MIHPTLKTISGLDYNEGKGCNEEMRQGTALIQTHDTALLSSDTAPSNLVLVCIADVLCRSCVPSWP
jgi:hypothetical protein